jgi:hypothetical protein
MAAGAYGIYLFVQSPVAQTFWNTITGKGTDPAKPVGTASTSEVVQSGQLYKAAKSPGQVK